jgi:hypothetical protein
LQSEPIGLSCCGTPGSAPPTKETYLCSLKKDIHYASAARHELRCAHELADFLPSLCKGEWRGTSQEGCFQISFAVNCAARMNCVFDVCRMILLPENHWIMRGRSTSPYGPLERILPALCKGGEERAGRVVKNRLRCELSFGHELRQCRMKKSEKICKKRLTKGQGTCIISKVKFRRQRQPVSRCV